MKGSVMDILMTTKTEQRVIKLKGSFRKSVLRDLKAQERTNRKVNRNLSKTKSTFRSLINKVALSPKKKSVIPARA